MKEIISTSPEHTQQIATLLAGRCVAGDCIALIGNLGAGKTCFSQGFIRALTGTQNAQSPTFLLIKSYEAKGVPPIHHMDFYRIEQEGELVELGLEEYLPEAICLIEWPDIAKSYFPDDYLSITIENTGDNTGDNIAENERKITFTAKGDWQERLNNINLPLC